MKQVKTILGYDLYEVISALQKEIRRGKELEAIFWVLELMESKFFSLVIERLKIICYEDCSIGDYQAVVFAQKAIEDAEYFISKQSSAWKFPLVSAVIALCRMNKSRDSHYAYVVSCNERREVEAGKKEKKIPHYAIDMHTKQGKILGKSLEDFYQEGVKVFPKDVSRYYEKAKQVHLKAKQEGKLLSKNIFNTTTVKKNNKKQVHQKSLSDFK
jgi:replication-associated recombination protein RarA